LIFYNLVERYLGRPLEDQEIVEPDTKSCNRASEKIPTVDSLDDDVFIE
jgi:hypothetical protein